VQQEYGPYSCEWVIESYDESTIVQKRSDALLPHRAALAIFFDQKAREKQYDSVVTICMRAGYPSRWQEECLKFASWMETCENSFFQWRVNVLDGTTDLVTPEQFIDGLPPLVW
jgi:hypothetical protein